MWPRAPALNVGIGDANITPPLSTWTSTVINSTTITAKNSQSSTKLMNGSSNT